MNKLVSKIIQEAEQLAADINADLEKKSALMTDKHNKQQQQIQSKNKSELESFYTNELNRLKSGIDLQNKNSIVAKA